MKNKLFISILNTAIAIVLISNSSLTFSQNLIVNEVSQGISGGKEYVEFIVVPSNSCQYCLDLRGWIIDDNNGYFSGGPASGFGIAIGAIRFRDVPFWSCIPIGTLITIYNDADINPQIGPIDTLNNDANCNLVIPISSTLFERHSSNPNSTSSAYSNTGWTVGGNWWSIGMSNSNDSFLTIDPSNSPNITHGVSWGNNNQNNIIYFSGSASGKVFSFMNTISNDPFDQLNWSSDLCSNGNETPGAPNSTNNSLFISQLNNNCTSINPNLNNSTTTLSICNNQLPFSWNNLTFNNAGSQTDTLVGANGCDSLATLNLSIYSTPSSTTNISICSSQLPYLWNSLTFNTGGSQTDTLIGTNGCDSLAILNLSVLSAAFSSTDISVCPLALPYSWNNLTFNSAGSQTDTLLTANGCDSLATLNLTITSASFSYTDIAICENQLPFTWNNLTFNSAGSQTDSLLTVNGCDSLATLNLLVNTSSQSTSYVSICDNQLPYSWNNLILYDSGSETDSLTAINGCDSLATINLTVFPTYNWIDGDSLINLNTNICSNQLPITINGVLFDSEGIIIDSLLNVNGCDSIVKHELIVYNCELIIPSAFTPDNDLVNDYWELYNIDLYFPSNIVTIYNRWGQKIFESIKGSYSENPWNGRYKDEELPVGSYYYTIELNEAKMENKSGSVSIIR